MNILHTIRLPRPAWRLASLFALMLTALILLPAVAQAQSPPRTPGVVTVSRSDGALHAFWQSGGGATSYHITYTSDNGKSWQLAALNHPAGNGTTSITITGVDNSKPYIVGVRARNSAGDSAWRNSSSIGRYEPPPPPPKSPAAPTGLSATGSDKSVTLSWNKPTGDVTGYQFRFREYPGPGWGDWYSVPDGDRNTTYYTIGGLENGTEYRFKLRAVNSGAVSIPAPTSAPWYVSATPDPDVQPPPPPSAPDAPTNLSVYRHDGKLVVYWDASDGADNYDARYSSDGGKNWLIAAWQVNTTGATISGIDNVLPYIVGVRARNHIGESAWTNSDTIPPPTLSTTNISTTTATLSISNHNAEWYYKANKGPDSACQSVAAGTSSDNLMGLTATTTYIYTAYSDNGCSSELGAAHWFVTRLSASNITNSPRTYYLHCLASNRDCAMGFITGASSGGYTLESATIKFYKLDPDGDLGNIRVTLHTARGHWRGDNRIPTNTALATLSGSNPTGTSSTPGDYTYTCSSAGCALSPNTTYFIQANADAGEYENEYYLWKTTEDSSDTLLPSDNGWTLLDELDWGGHGHDWHINNIELGLFELQAKPEPALDASSVTTISATLTLSHYGGAWWLKRTTPADTTCKPKGTTATESLTTLTADTTYTYKAYSKDGCESADEIATATFSTPSS